MALRGCASRKPRQTVESLLRPLRKHRDILERTSQHAPYKASVLVPQRPAAKSQALPALLSYVSPRPPSRGVALHCAPYKAFGPMAPHPTAKSEALLALLPYLLQSRTTKGQALPAAFPCRFQSHFEA